MGPWRAQPLQAAPARLHLSLLWAITCWRKECGAGQGQLQALLTAPNSSEHGERAGGEHGVVFSQECQVLEERGFFSKFLCHGVSEGSIHPSLFHRGGEIPRGLSGRAVEESCRGFVRLKGEVV